jgi:hypothetical protein
MSMEIQSEHADDLYRYGWTIASLPVATTRLQEIQHLCEHLRNKNSDAISATELRNALCDLMTLFSDTTRTSIRLMHELAKTAAILELAAGGGDYFMSSKKPNATKQTTLPEQPFDIFGEDFPF